jgi:hypothetical protein
LLGGGMVGDGEDPRSGGFLLLLGASTASAMS